MAKMVEDLAKTIHDNRGWFIALGVVLIVVGTGAILFPFMATLSAEIFIGWLLVIGGIVQIVHAFRVKDWGGFFWELLIGALELIAGAILLFYPLAGMVALTVFLAVMFIIEGAFRAALAFKIKPLAGWGWVLTGGILSGIVGVLIWAQLPSSSLWALGLLVGINIVMAGWTLVMLAVSAGNLPPEKKADEKAA